MPRPPPVSLRGAPSGKACANDCPDPSDVYGAASIAINALNVKAPRGDGRNENGRLRDFMPTADGTALLAIRTPVAAVLRANWRRAGDLI
jgi:hypothetical protein